MMHSPTAAEVVALRTARAAMEDREGPDSPVERIVYALGAAGLLIYPGDLAALREAVLREATATIRRAHAAAYEDAGRRTADGVLRAADLIDPDRVEALGGVA